MNNLKKNFIVSGSNNFWKSDLKKCSVSNPQLRLKYKKHLNNYFSNIEYLDNTRKTTQDLQNDSDFIDLKYKKYSKIFSQRLNLIHKKKYSNFFWSKALSIGFLRQITSASKYIK